METKQAKRSVYQIVTDRIVELLKKGTVPWKQPWTDKGLPMNLVTKRQYRGMNLLLLNSLHYERNLFITLKQLEELGARYKKGEKGHMVVFWKWPKPEELDLDGPTQGPVFKYYQVFNLDQCEGIPEHLIPEIEERPVNPIPACEMVLNDMQNKPTIKFKEKTAFYNPLIDELNMPKITSFDKETSYYATFFHELIHSTGHPKRLNRKGLLEMDEYGYYYSFEELVAEIGAAFLESYTGIAEAELDQNASYISNWLQRLESDPRMIVFASSAAQKATDYILNIEKEEFTEEKEEIEE